MSSADHEHMTIDACEIYRAANGGWIVQKPRLREEFMPEVVAAVSTLSELQEWLGAHLDNSPT